MGNSHNKNTHKGSNKESAHLERGQAFASQFSLSQFGGNSSGRSLGSIASNQSVYSASRPWSRISRRRWTEATLQNPFEASKTAWPVAHKESIFLPEFPIKTDFQRCDFEIQETIAKGAFGQVYIVKKVSEDKDYALKILSKSQVISERAVHQVKEEIRIQGAVGHHSFIAGAVERWQTKKRLYIVSEYIPGGELLALLDKYKKLPEQLVKIFVAEIAIAIDFLHNAGIIYRDLKPENILLDEDLNIKLVDFGLSKWLSFGDRTSTLCGTLKYMAPEILSGEPYGHAVDWWSLGAVASCMLTGELPTPAANIENEQDVNDLSKESTKDDDKKMSIHRKQPGTLPASACLLSDAARGLLMRLLERNPRVRMRNLRQLQQSAFFMGFNFEHVKAKKVSPKAVLEQVFPNETPKQNLIDSSVQLFATFDQSVVI